MVTKTPGLSPVPVGDSEREKIVLSWSGGKDSVLALGEILRSGRYEVEALLANVMEGSGRIAMHDVPIELIERQAACLGQTLQKVYLPASPTNEQYLARVGEVLGSYKAKGVRSVAFGDLFLDDIKDFRERSLAPLSLRGLYPVWARDTGALARHFVDAGFKAVIVCVDGNVLNGNFAGRLFDHDFLKELPPHIDPCGENGEFHTFVFDGPLFSRPVPFRIIGQRHEGRFHYCDLLPL